MAKGQHLSRYQKGIVRRFYEHRDTILVTRLQEIVSDLALAETDAARDKLWKRAADALGKIKTDPPLPESRLEKVLGERDLAGVAQLASELQVRS